MEKLPAAAAPSGGASPSGSARTRPGAPRSSPGLREQEPGLARAQLWPCGEQSSEKRDLGHANGGLPGILHSC